MLLYYRCFRCNESSFSSSFLLSTNVAQLNVTAGFTIAVYKFNRLFSLILSRLIHTSFKLLILAIAKYIQISLDEIKNEIIFCLHPSAKFLKIFNWILIHFLNVNSTLTHDESKIYRAVWKEILCHYDNIFIAFSLNLFFHFGVICTKWLKAKQWGDRG